MISGEKDVLNEQETVPASENRSVVWPEPLTKDEADALWKMVGEQKKKRATDMPTEQDAIDALWSAYRRLEELGWSDAIYCPKDRTVFEVIEAGSSRIHNCIYHGEWPNGSWWILFEGDEYPSRPILFRLKTPNTQLRSDDLLQT